MCQITTSITRSQIWEASVTISSIATESTRIPPKALRPELIEKNSFPNYSYRESNARPPQPPNPAATLRIVGPPRSSKTLKSNFCVSFKCSEVFLKNKNPITRRIHYTEHVNFTKDMQSLITDIDVGLIYLRQLNPCW